MDVGSHTSSGFWIIGYGNSLRRDDGIGPAVIELLHPAFVSRPDVHLQAVYPLQPDVIHAWGNAGTILFVDATVEKPAAAVRWAEIQPEPWVLPCATHQTTPSFLLGLLQRVSRRQAKVWGISVGGVDFRFGSGLSPEARKGAERAAVEISEYILTDGAKKDSIFFNRKAVGHNRRLP